jgi:hypothetical protein
MYAGEMERGPNPTSDVTVSPWATGQQAAAEGQAVAQALHPGLSKFNMAAPEAHDRPARDENPS